MILGSLYELFSVHDNTTSTWPNPIQLSVCTFQFYLDIYCNLHFVDIFMFNFWLDLKVTTQGDNIVTNGTATNREKNTKLFYRSLNAHNHEKYGDPHSVKKGPDSAQKWVIKCIYNNYDKERNIEKYVVCNSKKKKQLVVPIIC